MPPAHSRVPKMQPDQARRSFRHPQARQSHRGVIVRLWCWDRRARFGYSFPRSLHAATFQRCRDGHIKTSPPGIKHILDRTPIVATTPPRLWRRFAVRSRRGQRWSYGEAARRGVATDRPPAARSRSSTPLAGSPRSSSCAHRHRRCGSCGLMNDDAMSERAKRPVASERLTGDATTEGKTANGQFEKESKE